MKDIKLLFYYMLMVLFTLVVNGCQLVEENDSSANLQLNMRHKAPHSSDSLVSVTTTKREKWEADKTAIIVTDMWDQHWCKGATARVAELAPFMNSVISKARQKGILIVYAPSDCMDYYKSYPGRIAALKYGNTSPDESDGSTKLPSEQGKKWPIDQSNEGCNDTPRCEQRNAWTKQIDALQIRDEDIISDSGAELKELFAARGIDNVMLMGVHTNMCIIHRPFGLRNMIRYGKNVVLVRDLTDAMYDSRQFPYINHFSGVNLMLDYIEKYISPTILSTDISNNQPFHFSADPARLASR